MTIEYKGKSKVEQNQNPLELLAPAGNLEKLKFAIDYGADAVYLGGKSYGLRAFAGNFSREDMRAGVDYAHSRGRKVYITVNIFPHNEDLEGLEEYLKELQSIGVDAIIISDPGILRICKETVPEMEIHLSTQANCTNWRSAKFWKDQGINRIILARELSLAEIEQIHRMESNIEFETFVHGAMCISYSGRCLLSNYLANRDANRGECAHPCRWQYYLMERERPGEYLPITEDQEGTKIMSSKDLCMIRHIPELIDAGIKNFKIEGRMKSVHYVATVVRAYRKAINAYLSDPDNYSFKREWEEELKKASTRPFSTGFYFGSPDETDQEYTKEPRQSNRDFVGIVLNSQDGYLTIQQRNHFQIGDRIEIIGPNKTYGEFVINEIINSEGKKSQAAPHPKEVVTVPLNVDCEPNSLIRKILG
ncbi:peptidase U32 family protein [Natranaerobius thermophilus]|uniref:Peptidase U32 n=1 Tax=Natranaerobius thermophilus (strain ATCC BAA-1301 / DSM 18059 / JW/NM-WN-LF) TaxID=457570 RepID=B2A5J2_NATTJ|nr:U32 family peptidase [Natranaerobius thermophilus]ACB85347.1 peptidase U32 [Natranaerobius thermophilus JW/NM-WN-LF]